LTFGPSKEALNQVSGGSSFLVTVGQQIEFGPFRADTLNNCLVRDGIRVELRPQAFQVLCSLASHGGQFVGYEQMIREAWGGTVVSKHTVAVTVGEVKKVLREFSGWITYRAKLGYRLDVPHSEELIKKGWHFANRHTREGFEKAIQYFQEAADEASGDFRAYEGASHALLFLATWGMYAPRETYSRFLDAHGHAVALRGLTPELRADRAHGLHVFERRMDEAEADLIHARREKPGVSGIHVRLAMLYLSQGRIAESMATMAETSRSEHLSPLVASTWIVIYLCARRYEEALVRGRHALELHPYHQLSRFFYADALECAGRCEEALAEYRQASVVSPDLLWLRAMEGSCLAKSGRHGEALDLLRELKQLQTTEYVDSYHLALFQDALGLRDEAIAELQRACDDNSSMLHMLHADPKLDGLRRDPRFDSISERAFASQLVQAQAS
jgi:DNA-binding winged helix-turn-helix (wHTH) protein/Flp pilus assembly protein TadD